MGNIVGVPIRFIKHIVTGRTELERWSERVATRIAAEGIAAVLKDQVNKLVDVGASNPEFLIAQIEKWMRADTEYAPLCSEQNLASVAGPQTAETRAASARSCRPGDPVPRVTEADGTPVKVYRNPEFVNWGDTVSNKQKFIFVPKTKVGVQNVVKYAKEQKLRVRVSGSRHSWSEVFGRDGGVMISMMEIAAAVPDPDWARHPFKTVADNPYDAKNELQRIEFVGPTDDGQHARIRLGGATTSEHFRQWALSEQAFKGAGGKHEWMLRALPILVSITSAGWTQVICHGAGIKHRSVSDLCTEIEFVNYNGELQTVSDPEQLKALAGGFGLFGVITSHVFVMDPLKVANLLPDKVPAPLGVPPLTYDGIPNNDDFSTADYTVDEWQAATDRFKADCKKFYAEWFWFPFHPQAWINAWDTEDKCSGRQPQYPSRADVKSQNEQARLFWIFQNTLLKFLPPVVQTDLTSYSAMVFLPPNVLTKSTRTTVPDALHFRRGIHRMPVRDSEFSMQIPDGPDGPDFSICQRAWWAAIEEVYKDKEKGKAPMRVTLEMRIVGGSETTMSTQNGNCATCAIEVLTSTLVDQTEWDEFMVRIANRWAAIAGDLHFKPHFAKEWPKTIGGQTIDQYLKCAYADKIPEFVGQLSAAAKDGGYSLQQALSLFGNETILNLIGTPGS